MGWRRQHGPAIARRRFDALHVAGDSRRDDGLSVKLDDACHVPSERRGRRQRGGQSASWLDLEHGDVVDERVGWAFSVGADAWCDHYCRRVAGMGGFAEHDDYRQ